MMKKTTCYILVGIDGLISQVHHTMSELQSAYNAVLNHSADLFAVWPGKYSSDLFIVDDLDTFADAVGIPRKTDHTHILDWKISDYDDRNSRSAKVECSFKCGCSFRKMGIKKFANDMLDQKGWKVATSVGWSSHGDTFTVSVSRASLRKENS